METLRLDRLITSIETARSGTGHLDHLTDAVVMAARLDEIADELVGHFVESARAEGASWAEVGMAMGTTRQAAQKRFVEPRRRKGRRSGFFLTRFATEARRLVTAAEEAARAAGCDRVETRHLLLSITEDPDGVGARAIAGVGASLEEVRRKASEPDEGGGDPSQGHIRFGPDMKKALELSLREAIRSDERQITETHILLALCRDKGSPAGVILAMSGVDRDKLEDYLGAAIA